MNTVTTTDRLTLSIPATAANGKEPKAGSTIITVSLDPEIKDGVGKEGKPEEKSQDRSDAADKLS